MMVSWLPETRLDEPQCQYDLVELFAGEAKVSSVHRLAGRRVAALDIAYDEQVERPGSMDLTTSAGFTWLSTEFQGFQISWFQGVS